MRARARPGVGSLPRRLRLVVIRFRRIIAALALGVAAAATLSHVTPTLDTIEVLVTTREVRAGEPLSGATTVAALARQPLSTPALAPGDLAAVDVAGHRLAAGEIVYPSDLAQWRIPAGQVAVPVSIPARFQRWIDPGDQLLLYPGRSTTDEYLPPLDAPAPHEPIGPVRVLETELDTGSLGSADSAAILVLIDRDQAPRLAEVSGASWLLPALMP